MKIIKAKYRSTCAETGAAIGRGEDILWDRASKRAWCEQSDKFREHQNGINVQAMIQANEDAYYDNFCLQNNI